MSETEPIIREVTAVELTSKSEFNISVQQEEDSSSHDFVLRCNLNGKEIFSSGNAYFIAFQDFRDKMLAAGYGLKCNGALINAHASAMMENSDKVYLLKFGSQALMKDVVNIWDPAQLEDFPDTKAQEDFFEEWTASLTSGRPIMSCQKQTRSYKDLKSVDNGSISFTDGMTVLMSEIRSVERNNCEDIPYFLFKCNGFDLRVIFDKKGILAKSRNKRDFLAFQRLMEDHGITFLDLS